MIYIAHRGNTEGRKPELENTPEYIGEAIRKGFDVEVDVWKVNDDYYLGHDSPDNIIEFSYLLERSKLLWCHAKNIEALDAMRHYGQLNCFWHQKDDYTLTSNGYIWSYPNSIVLPYKFKQIALVFDIEKNAGELNYSGGVCSDHISFYKSILDKCC